MPPNQPLRLDVNLSGMAPCRELEISVRQYARQLCADLGLPATVVLSLTAADGAKPNGPEPFGIAVNGRRSRDRWWPQRVLPDSPSPQHFAALVNFALYERREDLITPELAALLRTAWRAYAWAIEAFSEFARLFARYNFSLRHAEALVKRERLALDSETAVASCFEQAIEDAADLTLGSALYLSNDEFWFRKEKKDWTEGQKIAQAYGFLTPETRIEAGLLRPGEVQFQLNDIHLPVMRVLSRNEVLLSADEITKLSAAGHFRLFDPIFGVWYFAAESSPDVITTQENKLSSTEYLGLLLRWLLLANAGSLLASPVVYLMLDRLGQSAPALVNSLPVRFPRLGPPHRWLTSVLRRLLDERVTIRDLAAILEGLVNLREIESEGTSAAYHFSELPDSPVHLAPGGLADLSLEHLTAAARLGLRSLIVSPERHEIVPMLALPRKLEQAIATSGGPIDSNTAQQMMGFLTPRDNFDELAIVVDQDVRQRVRAALRLEFPTLRIIGTHEAPPALVADACHSAARSLVKRRVYQEALELAARAASLEPEQPAYHYELGQIYDLLQRGEEAERQYLRVKDFASDLRWRIAAADAFFERKSYDTAIRIYRELAEKSETATDYDLLGNRLVAIGAVHRAIEAYEQAAAKAPNQAVYHGHWAGALTEAGNYLTSNRRKRPLYEEAVREFEEAIRLDSTTAWYHQGLGVALTQLALMDLSPDAASDLTARAGTELREAVDLDPKNPAAWIELVRYLSREKKFDEALAALKKAASLVPAALQIQAALARAYAQAGDYQEAVRTAEKLNQAENRPADASDLLAALQAAVETEGKRREDPKNDGFVAELGHVQARLGNLQAALELYSQAARLAPSKTEPHKWLGNTLYKLGDYAGAAAEWEKAGEDPLILNNLGTAYDGLGDNQKALGFYQRACELAPANFVPHYNLGSTYYRLREWESALAAYRKSSECNPTFAPTHLNVGNCCFRLAQQGEAVSEWRKDAVSEWKESIRLDPKLIDARYNLGVALYLEAAPESRHEAEQQWSEALALDRNFSLAEDNYLALGRGDKPPDLDIVDVGRPRE